LHPSDAFFVYRNEKQRQGTNNQYVKSEKGQNVPFQTTAEKIAQEKFRA